MNTNPDPDSYIQSSARLLAETLSSKNSDYKIDGEFSNFEEAAKLTGVHPAEVILIQIAIKFGRIKGLLTNSGSVSVHESVQDSLLDLAGYAIIAHAYAEANSVDARLS